MTGDRRVRLREKGRRSKAADQAYAVLFYAEQHGLTIEEARVQFEAERATDAVKKPTLEWRYIR
ncbi:MAG: hypothetical protein ABIQ30_00925 [Devosia sp.]